MKVINPVFLFPEAEDPLKCLERECGAFNVFAVPFILLQRSPSDNLSAKTRAGFSLDRGY
jgi:hypothetical protein